MKEENFRKAVENDLLNCNKSVWVKEKRRERTRQQELLINPHTPTTTSKGYAVGEINHCFGGPTTFSRKAWWNSVNGYNKWHNEILIKFCLLVFHDLLDVRKITIVFGSTRSYIFRVSTTQLYVVGSLEVTRISLSNIN